VWFGRTAALSGGRLRRPIAVVSNPVGRAKHLTASSQQNRRLRTNTIEFLKLLKLLGCDEF
jgi:hypothetical protein